MDTQVLKGQERKLAVLKSVNCFLFKKNSKQNKAFIDPYSLCMRWKKLSAYRINVFDVFQRELHLR